MRVRGVSFRCFPCYNPKHSVMPTVKRALQRRKVISAAALAVLSLAGLAAFLVQSGESEETQAPPAQFSGRVAFDGTNYFVVWEGTRKEGIYGARVNQSGSVLDRSAIPISKESSGEGDPRVAFDGTNYLVAWTDARSTTIGEGDDVYAARVSQAGKVLDRTGIPIATGANHLQVGGVAFDGTNFLVVWDGSNPNGYGISGARVDEAGRVLDPEGFVISKGAEEQYSPSVAFGGTTYFVSWTDRRGWPDSTIYGARVSQAGKVLRPAGISISSSDAAQAQSIAFGDDDYLVTWTHGDELNYDVRGTRVSEEGIVLEASELVIGRAGAWGQQWQSSAAFDGTNYFVAWEDARYEDDYGDVYGTRVSPTGKAFEPQGTAIRSERGFQETPSVAFGESNYLVTWMESSEIFGARVDKDGEVIDPIPISISRN